MILSNLPFISAGLIVNSQETSDEACFLALTRKVQWRLEIIGNKLLEDVETLVKFQKANLRGFIRPRSLAWAISGATAR